jgi:uncharacterized protein
MLYKILNITILAPSFVIGGLAICYSLLGGYKHPLSVAQHSITVMLLRRAAAPAITPLEELRELLHDAEEGLLGFDAISVIKPFLGDAFRALTRRLEHMVFLRYGLPAWDARSHAAHKRADRLAAATEAVHVAGWSREEVRRTLKIRAGVLAEDPLAAYYDCRPWEPWAPGVACERFMRELERLALAVRSTD